MNDLTPIAWFVATQFLLYAIGWAICGAMLRERQSAVTHWGVFMLLVGAGFALASMRDDSRAWWPYVGSSLAFLAGFSALWRGLEQFFLDSSGDREIGATLAILVMALVALGPQTENSAWRVLLSYGGGLWICLRIIVAVGSTVLAEFGRCVGITLMSPAALLIVLYLVRIDQQLNEMDAGLEMMRHDAMNVELLYGYLVGAAIFNFSFMAMLTFRMLGRLRAQALRDPLTGLPNRRALDRLLEREVERLRRGEDGFAVLALDVDHFKHINDTYGHQAGDTVLEQLGLRLRDVVRETDTVARTGGEEFLVLAPATDARAAAHLAERVRAGICGTPFRLADARLAVTVSVGVTLCDSPDTQLLQFLKRADNALYRAKAGGRNQVQMA